MGARPRRKRGGMDRVDEHRRALVIAVTLGAGAMVAPMASAQVFSVGPGGPSGLLSNRLYVTQATGPVVVGGGAGMGLQSFFDDLDAISYNAEPPADLHIEWQWWFSVDSGSLGLPPEVLPGFNVANQAALRQVAGDIFMSTEAFDPDTGLLPPPISLGLNNNALVINQAERYPGVFLLLPNVPPFLSAPVGSDQDEVNAAMRGDPPGPGQRVYFSLAAGSPSLPLVVPGVVPSGANIFADVDVNNPGSETLYAQAGTLGLVINDDIDGLVVFDQDENGVYNAFDAVYFTLTRGSPSLANFGGSAASILRSRFGVVTLAVEHTFLGLAFNDAIDGLDIVELVGDSALLTIESELGPFCAPDISGHANPALPGLGTPDGVVNNEDFFCYLIFFAAGNARADMTTGAIPGSPGYGVPNGIINNDDFFFFLNIFVAGC